MNSSSRNRSPSPNLNSVGRLADLRALTKMELSQLYGRTTGRIDRGMNKQQLINVLINLHNNPRRPSPRRRSPSRSPSPSHSPRNRRRSRSPSRTLSRSPSPRNRRSNRRRSPSPIRRQVVPFVPVVPRRPAFPGSRH
jgi:hypothetical protein